MSTTPRETITPSVSALAAATGGDAIDHQTITTIRLLAADAVEAAKSGHPGLPMGCATPAYTIWSRFLRHDPRDPAWPDRDRFVLSAGHGSMLLYALLHLSGYDLSLADLRGFRQWGSKTPGHPEYGHTPGVETTTGPLGQGLGNAVGMALGERMLAARFNRGDAPTVVDHRTFVLASDGDMMEGLSHEAAALAGHLGLGRLVVLYDDNQISIDGPTSLAMSDDVGARFRSYGWHVQHLDGEGTNDVDAVAGAVDSALVERDRPSLIVLRTCIGYGAPTKAGRSVAHGAPLGADEIRATKVRFGWAPDASFVVPDEVYEHMGRIAAAGLEQRLRWEEGWAEWARVHGDLAAEWNRRIAGRLPEGLGEVMIDADEDTPMATRVASGRALSMLAERVPELVGGSADLAESTNTAMPGGDVRRGDFSGRVLRFGVREHGMGAVLNGLALHGGLRPFGSTFLVFSDYMRPSIRLAALMGLPVVYVFTHDSVALGEDGPTHQPVEHLLALRAIPGLAVLRPADAHETMWAWRMALRRRDGPTALILSRQPLTVLHRDDLGSLDAVGARVIRDTGADVAAVIVATGSEVTVALGAATVLEGAGIATRVVSMPWRERFLESPLPSQTALIPPGALCVAVEAGLPLGWETVTGRPGRAVGIERFGASAPGARVLDELGITPQAVANQVLVSLTIPD